jgi:hypothetical protein
VLRPLPTAHVVVRSSSAPAKKVESVTRWCWRDPRGEEATMHIEFTQDELDLLRELLERANADLREEVHKTEAIEWKRALKARERVLGTLLAKLGA